MLSPYRENKVEILKKDKVGKEPSKLDFIIK